MSLRKRLAIFLLVLLVAGALDALLAPFVVARGVRFWLEWTARRHGLTAEIGLIEAAFLRPVTIHQLAIGPAKDGPRDFSLGATTIVADLDFLGWIFRQDAHLLHSLRVDSLKGHLRVAEAPRSVAGQDWRQWERLLPDEFQFNDLDFDFATGLTEVSFRGVLLTANVIESGQFFAREIYVTAPLLRQTFTKLRGATSWEGSRLTIAGIPLARGLDLEALTLDLSRLARRRLGIDLHLDTYGGTLRASFQVRASKKFVLDLAGSAANVSLAQISSAMGFLEPITGSVRSSKFTFRGNPGQFLDATASVWMEATDFAWRARRADSVMFGATYYNRRFEVDQLYVRQRQNELTVNGELLWPKKPTTWAQLPFRGQINASIPDLNGFAQFWGARTGDFSGALTAAGEVDLVGAEASGRLTLEGRGVTYRGVDVDSLGASLRLHGREAALENLEARHGEDFLRAQGTVELTAAHRFAGRLTGAIENLGVYAPLLPAGWRSEKIGGGVTFDWRGDGTPAAHSGTVQLFAHGLHLPVTPLRAPLDLTLEGSYSPRDIFFRTFKLANDRFSLGGFLMFGTNFVELQSFELVLDGTRRVGGTLFLPLSLERWRTSQSWLAALDPEQKFDVDLSVAQLDLAALGSVLGEKSLRPGLLNGKLAAFGPLRTLQVTTTWRLENPEAAVQPSAIDFHGRIAEGRLDAEASARFGVSTPVTGRASLPLRLEKQHLESGQVLDPAQPFSAAVEAPALFLEMVPAEWRFGIERGLATGNVSWEGKLSAPAITGEASLFQDHLAPPPPWPEVDALRAHIRFHDTEAEIDSLHGEVNGTPFDLRGRATASLSHFGVSIWPQEAAIELLSQPPEGISLSGVRFLGAGQSEDQPRLREARLRGEFRPPSLSLTIVAETAPDAGSRSFQTTYFLKPNAAEAETLLLRVVPSPPAANLQLRPTP